MVRQYKKASLKYIELDVMIGVLIYINKCFYINTKLIKVNNEYILIVEEVNSG